MNGRYVRLFLTVLLLLAVASPTFAARRSSLAGNLLIQDADDMFFFPQLVTMHNRMVTFDFGTNSGLGSGGMVFGSERITVGLFSHRSDFLGTIDSAFLTRGDIDNINSAGAIGVGVGPDAMNWIDLLVGFQSGDNPVGVRLSLARSNIDPQDPPSGETKADATAFNIIVGTRLASRGIDGSVEFGYASTKNNDGGPPVMTDEMSPWQIAVAVRRTAMDESDALFLGWLGMFSYYKGTEDQATGATTTSIDNSQALLQVGAGPVYHPNERTNVAMYGTFDYRHGSQDQANVGKSTQTDFIIPGWNVAAEVEITSWMQFRSGLRSEFAFASDKTEPTAGNSSEDKFVDLSFEWTTGIGLRAGNFTFDGYLNPDVITTGTDFFGNSNQLFGLVTTTLTF